MFLAGVFLTADADRACGSPTWPNDYARRTLAVGDGRRTHRVRRVCIPILRDAPTLSRGLRRRRLAAAGGGRARRRRHPCACSIAEAYSVARVHRGCRCRRQWSPGGALAQYPWMLVDQLTINDAAGAKTTLAGLVVVIAAAVVIVLPALAYLLRLTQTEKWSRA